MTNFGVHPKDTHCHSIVMMEATAMNHLFRQYICVTVVVNNTTATP